MVTRCEHMLSMLNIQNVQKKEDTNQNDTSKKYLKNVVEK